MNIALSVGCRPNPCRSQSDFRMAAPDGSGQWPALDQTASITLIEADSPRAIPSRNSLLGDAIRQSQFYISRGQFRDEAIGNRFRESCRPWAKIVSGCLCPVPLEVPNWERGFARYAQKWTLIAERRSPRNIPPRG